MTLILLHAKWSNLQNTQQNSIEFSVMLLLGEDEKMIQEKFCWKFVKSDLSQDLMKQTLGRPTSDPLGPTSQKGHFDVFFRVFTPRP